MNVSKLLNLHCQEIRKYNGTFQEQSVIVIDTETVQGKPYTVQMYDGIATTLEYVNEKTIFEVYTQYIAKRCRANLCVWFFYAPFDLPILHYPFKDYFCHDGHTMSYGEFSFEYISGKTWFGNHTYKGYQWFERDAFQYVFRGLEKVAKDLQLSLNKKPRPIYLGEREPTEEERPAFEAYAIADVLVLWELVYWILSIHRQYNVGLSVSLADLCGKIFRAKYVHTPIRATDLPVTMAALQSYHGGKTESYLKGPVIVQGIKEYDIVSAYPYAMTQIGNFFDYSIEESTQIQGNGLYQVSGNLLCSYHPLYTHDFKRENSLIDTWVTGWELLSAQNCFHGVIQKGYIMTQSHNGTVNGLSEYVWDFFAKKKQAKQDKNRTEYLWAKLAMNALYGKFIAKILDELDLTETWKGGVIFHPLVATLITGYVRAYVHTIEHECCAYHTSTDSFITKHDKLDTIFTGHNGLGGLEKVHSGDALIIRPKVYLIFDKLEPDCYHQFDILEETEDIQCIYCKAKVLKSATHGFYGSVQLLLNMWGKKQTNYLHNRMMRLKEAKKRKDPEILPFVFSKQRRSLNVDWNKLTIYRG